MKRLYYFLRRLFYRRVYLHTPHWQRVRLAALARAGYRCEICGVQKPLDVHHIFYGNLWHEHPKDLQAICRECHNFIHGKIQS